MSVSFSSGSGWPIISSSRAPDSGPPIVSGRWRREYLMVEPPSVPGPTTRERALISRHDMFNVSRVRAQRGGPAGAAGLVTFVCMFESPGVLDGLNDEQRRAATHPGGPLLMLAGAGTGKTRTLVARAAWLCEQGMAPSRILLLTFTRRAAEDMLSRAAACAQIGRES